MNKREMADYIRRNAVFRIHDEVATAAAAALEREAEREEKPSTRCSVSIAGGLVHGDFERVTAVQALILENEKLRREAREREEKAKPKVTLLEQRRVAAQAAADYSSGGEPETRDGFYAIADTLRRLDEEGGKLLLRLFSSDRDASRASGEFIRSLGVEPKP